MGRRVDVAPGFGFGCSLEVQAGQRMRVTSHQPKELALGTVGLGGNEVSLYSKKDERNVRRAA